MALIKIFWYGCMYNVKSHYIPINKIIKLIIIPLSFT